MISQTAAIDQARQLARDRGWLCAELHALARQPVFGRRRWIVVLNAGADGNTARVVVNAATGSTLDASYLMGRDEAVDRVKRIAAQEGWPWGDQPETIQLRLPLLRFAKGGAWLVQTNSALGANGTLCVIIDAETGAVYEKRYIPVPIR